ncbi:MAG: hypothetical protein ABR513_05755 [Desulfotignum sp.]
MDLFGKNGIVRQQEIAFAKKLLAWKYEKSGIGLPDEAVLQAHAQKIVADAHEIAKKRGRNVLEILKAQINDIRRK